jgi:hypothetical protein
MTYFADEAPNKLAENRNTLSTPDTSSVAKCSRLMTSGQSTFPELRRLETRFGDNALVENASTSIGGARE